MSTPKPPPPLLAEVRRIWPGPGWGVTRDYLGNGRRYYTLAADLPPLWWRAEVECRDSTVIGAVAWHEERQRRVDANVSEHPGLGAVEFIRATLEADALAMAKICARGGGE